MPESDRGTDASPSHEELDPVERLMVECLEHPETQREQAFEQACAAHPDLEPALRSRWSTLRSMGLLGSEPGTAVPERLGEFRLLELLGAGGMGIVYLAEQLSLGREVALKVLRPESLYFPRARERFRREAEAVARLKHPGIVPVHAVGEEAGVPFLAMEYIPGATLAQVLERLAGSAPDRLDGRDLERAVGGPEEAVRATDATPFSGSWIDAVVEIARQLAEALQHAHEQGIVHRDVKPSNVVLTPAGRAKLLDFGLAELSGVDRLTRSGSTLGTLHYMAPEQLHGGTADARSDVYSLGATLYELLTLDPPYFAETRHGLERAILEGGFESARNRNRRVPPELDMVCAKALDLDPLRRYASARELAEELANVLARRPVRARPPGPLLLLRRWTQRHPALATAAVAGFLLVVVAPTVLLLSEQAHSRVLGEALEDRTRALDNERAARAAEQEALAEAEAAFEYLGSLMFAANPIRSGGQELLVADVLEAGVARIDGLADHPRLQVRLLTSLGQTLNALGRTPQAVELLERAREIERLAGGFPDTQPGVLANSLANALVNLGRLEQARDVAFEALAELEVAGLGNSNEAGAALMTVGMSYLRARDPAAAEEYLSAAVEVMEAAPQRDTGAWIQASVMLANTLRARGRQAEVLDSLELLLEHAERELPPTSPFMCDVLDCVADARVASGDIEGGLAASHRAVETARKVHGDPSHVVGVYLFNQSRMLRRSQRLPEALEVVEQALDVLLLANGEEHPTTQTARRDRDGLRQRLGL